MSSPIAIVGGTGALGSALAARLLLAGETVRIGSRTAESAAQAVTRLTGLLDPIDPAAAARMSGTTNQQCVLDCELVILSVPFRAQSENLTNLKTALVADQILVDASVPLAAAISGKATRTIGVWQGSAAQQAQEMVPSGVKVVSALHTVSAAKLADLGSPIDEDVLIAGDDKSTKAQVAKLLEQIPNIRCVDCGKLEAARIMEQITALLIGVNSRYKSHAGIRLTDLPARDW